MKRVYIFTNSNSVFMHKLMAWALSIFIVISSFSVGKADTNISIADTAKISAETLVTQFFYLSTLPLNVITKLFTESENSAATPLAPAKNNKNSSKHDAAAQASAGYSIMPVNDLMQFTKVKFFSSSSLQNKVTKARFAKFFNDIFCFDGLFSVSFLLNFNIITLLLLAILLARRNIGDDNIVLSIENNMYARLI